MRFAAEHGIHAAFFGVDSTRAERDFYDQVYSAAVEAGAKEVVVVDTLGIASPEAVAELVGHTVELVDVPVHFHGHNDFGVATASAVAAVRAGATYVHGTINGMGERAGNANLGEVALTLKALYGVESNLRLDRIRDVSARVRELSGYELEPWKPVTGETLYRRESGAVASQFHDPQSIEPYSSELVATRALDRPRQEERARLGPHQGGGARARPAGRAARRGAGGGEEARRDRAAPRHRRRVQGDRWLTTTRSSSAVGVNGLACAALLAKGGWNVCVLERNDWFGGAIKTDGDHRAGVQARRVQRLASALGRRGGACAARRRAGAARPRVPEHRPADGDRVSGRRERVSPAHSRGQHRGAR